MCSFKVCQSSHGKMSVHSPSFLNLDQPQDAKAYFSYLAQNPEARDFVVSFMANPWDLKNHCVFPTNIDPKDSWTNSMLCSIPGLFQKWPKVWSKEYSPKNARMSELCWHVADRIGLCQATSRSWSLEGGASTSAESMTGERFYLRLGVLEINTWIKQWGIPITPIIFKNYDTGFRFCG